MKKSTKNPLIIDLDGSLIKNDLLIDSALFFTLKNPLNIFRIIGYLLKGKANLKYQLAKHVEIDAKSLPYNKQVLKIIEEEKAMGRKIILATASNEKYAKEISEHLGIFDGILASNESVNLRSKNKADKLIEEFGEGNFDYIGNSKDDLAVWSKCDVSYIIEPRFCLFHKLKKIYKARKNSKESQIKVVKDRNKKNPIRIWLKQIRVHQWSKNLLVFIPLLASHNVYDINLIYSSSLGFLFFSLCASSVYLLNDLVDLKNDRKHKSKKNRPIASGKISIFNAIISCILLLAISCFGSYYLMPLWFFISIISYYILTLSYSLILKKLEIFDVIILASLYTMRIIAGAFAISASLTFWILSFSMFIFLSLAFVKRHCEIYDHRKSGNKENVGGRGYYSSDLEMISALGTASGYLSVMILALYIQDPATIDLYSKPRIIWFSCPLFLFWISRIWMLAHRGKIHEDPVFFAIKDKVSWVVVIMLALIFWYAT